MFEIDFSLPFETEFAHGTCCVLIFVRGTCCVLIFSSWNLLHVHFSLRKTFKHWFSSSWNWFCSWNLLCADFLFIETCCVLIFVHETCCMLIFSVCTTCTSDFSPYENDCVYRTCCMLIFLHGNCCMLIFVLETCFNWFSLRWNLYIDFFSAWKRFCSWNLFHADFSFLELVVCWFCSWNKLQVDFSLHETYTLIFLLMKLILFMELVPC